MQKLDQEVEAHGHAAHHAKAASVINRAVTGAFWTIVSSSGARLVGIFGTLALTHFLSPDQYGEVSLAALIAVSASTLSNCGLGQYIVAKPKAGRAAVFHASFFFLVTGIVALALAVIFGHPLGSLVSAPGVVTYLPGFALAMLIDRVTTIQDRILVRDMRFRESGLFRSLGEIIYSVTAVTLAALGKGTIFGGGAALMWASLARSAVRFVALTYVTSRKDWLEPCRISWARTREIFGFSLPMSVAQLASFGAGRFDNFVYAHHFGQAAVSFYNLAYNFADIPAALIGEGIGDVLVPAFARLDDKERRKSTFLMSLRAVSLLVMPLAVGLAVVAPTLVKLTFKPAYQDGVVHILRLLSLFSVARTLSGAGTAYLQVRDKPRYVMGLELFRVVGIVLFVHLFAVLGKAYGGENAPYWAVTAVLFVFTMSTVLYAIVIHRLDGIPIGAQLRPILRPFVACLPMAAAVLGVRYLFDQNNILEPSHPLTHASEQLAYYGPRLVAEVVVGAVVFIPSALIIARGSAREVISLVRDARARKQLTHVEAVAA